MSNVTHQMRGAIGRQTGRRVSFPITDSDIRRWAVAVYWPDPAPPLFWDADYAKRSRHGGIVAPEEFNPFAWMVAEKDDPPVVLQPNDPNRLERILGIEGPGCKFQLNGGVAVEYGVRMRPHDVITAVGRLAEYRESEGKLGQMLFTITEDTWTNQSDEMVKRSRSTH